MDKLVVSANICCKLRIFLEVHAAHCLKPPFKLQLASLILITEMLILVVSDGIKWLGYSGN